MNRNETSIIRSYNMQRIKSSSSYIKYVIKIEEIL